MKASGRSKARVGAWALGLGLAWGLGFAAPSEAQEIKRFDNPYIFDGILRESPFRFSFPVEEVRIELGKNSQPQMNHLTRKNHKEIEEEWKAAYNARREISPGYIVIGHVFLTQQGHMSFTLRHQVSNTMMLVEVIPNPEGGGTNVRSSARQGSIINVAYKRAWRDFSPKGMEPFSVECDGH